MTHAELLKEIIKLYIPAYEEAYSGSKTKEDLAKDIASHSYLEKLNIGCYINAGDEEEARKGDPNDSIYAHIKIPKIEAEFTLSHGSIGVAYNPKSENVEQLDVAALLADVHDSLVDDKPFDKEVADYTISSETKIKTLTKKIAPEIAVKAKLYDQMFGRELTIKGKE